jgi:hypothetical protein
MTHKKFEYEGREISLPAPNNMNFKNDYESDIYGYLYNLVI